ncbi:dCMP deaminase family protein [Candidatus Woesearchaeota archaeon]|nr:dCMP deaminase family protein [Candidatus Woesearchaeota archaeon]
MQEKISWTQYFIEVSRLIAKKSSCVRRQVGAVVVKDNMIISTGYNGTARGVKNCNEGGCERCASSVKSGEGLHECMCVHAEENAIVQAAYQGIATKDAAIFTSHCPCRYCAKSIINAGIRKVYYNKSYSMDEETLELLREANVEGERYG